MMEQPSSSPDLPTDSDRHVVVFPTRYVPCVPTEAPAKSASRPAAGVRVRARRNAIRLPDVWRFSWPVPALTRPDDWLTSPGLRSARRAHTGLGTRQHDGRNQWEGPASYSVAPSCETQFSDPKTRAT